MSNTITLQDVANFCSTHADLLPLSGVGGYTSEPFLSLANDALSDLVSDPNDWKFNRVELPLLVSCPNKIDQLFAGACAFSLGSTSQGWGIALNTASGVTVTGGVVTINFLENHRFAVGDTVYMVGNVATTGTTSAYNSVFTDNGSSSAWSNGWVLTAITATSVSFAATSGQNNGDVAGAPGITNFGYATSASLQEMNNSSSPPNLKACTACRELPYISRVGNPDKISMLQDMGGGVLKFRYNFVPGNVTWGARLVYQACAPTKVALTDNWAPFPDNFSAVYRQALLYRMYRYLNDPKADSEFKKLQMEIEKVQGTDDAENTDVGLQPDCLMGNDYYSNAW